MTIATPARSLSGLIFASRWLQAPLYLGLVIAQLVYVVQFLKELWHLIDYAINPSHVPSAFEGFTSEAVTMLMVLGLVDVVMISNLLIMVIIGGYETFVSRMKLQEHPDQPEWLSHVNANVLKTKLAMSIIGISSIHLLRTFIESQRGGGSPGEDAVADRHTPGVCCFGARPGLHRPHDAVSEAARSERRAR